MKRKLLGLTAAAALVVAMSPIGQAGAGRGDKMEVIHKGRKTLCVSVNAVPAHVGHGDQVGDPC